MRLVAVLSYPYPCPSLIIGENQGSIEKIMDYRKHSKKGPVLFEVITGLSQDKTVKIPTLVKKRTLLKNKTKVLFNYCRSSK